MERRCKTGSASFDLREAFPFSFHGSFRQTQGEREGGHFKMQIRVKSDYLYASFCFPYAVDWASEKLHKARKATYQAQVQWKDENEEYDGK